jgi:hypothetical protein
MTSAYAAESNRRNAQRSTGPTSPEGKARSRFNALQHGATARVLALPGEDRDEIAKERDAWVASRATDDPIERAVLERAFEAWHQLGRTLRAQQGRVEQRMIEAVLVERRKAWDDALELGNRLFCDSNGPSQCYPNRPPITGTILTSGNDLPGDPNQPARLILRLESTAAGCRWLLARWKELGEILDAGECWRSPDRFRAIRLLGKQPLDALVDRDVRRIFLACHVLRPVTKSPFDDLLREVGDNPLDSYSVFRPALKQLTTEPYTPKDPAEARQVLTGLVDQAISQLKVLLAELEAREDEAAATAADRHAFDLDHDGELMRRYEASCDRSFHRALAQLRLLRKDGQAPPGYGTRKTAGETEQSRTVILAMQREPETQEQPLVGLTAPTALQPWAETATGALAPAPPQALVGDDPERGAAHGTQRRNEPDAASIDRDDSPGEPANHAESDPPIGPELRNEPDAAFSDRDDSANEAANRPEPGPRDGRKLRNEALAASVDRDDLAGRAVPRGPRARTPKPPDRPSAARPPRAGKLFANKQRVAGRNESRSRGPSTQPLRTNLEQRSPK